MLYLLVNKSKEFVAFIQYPERVDLQTYLKPFFSSYFFLNPVFKIFPVKPYRTHPSSNIQSSATQKCCGVVFFFFFCIFFFTISFFSIEKFVILRVKNFIPFYCICRDVITQNLNSLLRLVVAKWTFAVWFHAKFSESELEGDQSRPLWGTVAMTSMTLPPSKTNLVLLRYSVTQSLCNSSFGDIVLDSFNMVYGDEGSI